MVDGGFVAKSSVEMQELKQAERKAEISL